MDKALTILGSVFAGSLLNQKRLPRTRAGDKTNNIEPLVPNGTDIYNSRDFYKVSEKEATLVNANWEAAKNPATTGIIPMYYNTLHLSQDADKIPNPKYDQNLVYSVIDSLDGVARKILQVDKTKLIVNDSGRSKPDDFALITGLAADQPVSSEHGNLEQIGGGLLPNRGYEGFTHNNMVPFYRGSLKQNIDVANRMTEGKLETFTGQFKLKSEQKKENGPLFEPTTGFVNPYGTQFNPDMTRYVPSNLGKRNNELPFNQVLVGPGLNQGFTDQPSGGVHPMLRIMPKTVEELHVDPVVEQEGRILGGKSLISERPLIQGLYKNRQTLLVDNENGQRNFTTVGAIKEKTARSDIVLKNTQRKKSGILVGHAKSTLLKPTSIAKSRVSTRVNFNNTPFRNAVLAEGKKVSDYGKSGIHNRSTARSVTGIKSHLLNPKSWVTAITAYFKDAAKQTRKQHYIHSERVYGNVKSQRPSALPAYDPQATARTTIRETTEDANAIGNPSLIGAGKTPSYDPHAVARTTIRETTEDANAIGNPSLIGAGKTPSYDPQSTAKTTIRETTENSNHVGIFAPVNGVKNQVFNNQHQARTTVRETTEDSGHVGIAVPVLQKRSIAYDPNYKARTTIRETTEGGGIGHVGIVNGSQKKGKAYDPHYKARTTIRETTEEGGHVGNITATSVRKQKAYDPHQIARTTIRETTEDNRHLGGINNTTAQSGKGYQTAGVQVKSTQRQTTSDNQLIGPAHSNAKKTISYDSSYNARVNTEKEKIAEGRVPAKQGPKLLNTHVTVESKKMDDDRKNQYIAVKTSTVNNTFNPSAHTVCTKTTDKNYLPQEDTRLDPALVDAFNKNPLTQSLHSYA